MFKTAVTFLKKIADQQDLNLFFIVIYILIIFISFFLFYKIYISQNLL